MSTLSYAQLCAACEPAGATALSLVTELAAAGGTHAGVTPECAITDGDATAFGYQTRFVDEAPANVVIIDGNQSQLNRVEAAILQGIADQHPILSRVPRIQVSYGGGGNSPRAYTDLELPHRVYDGHIRAGTVDGAPVTSNPAYRSACDSSAADARAALQLSPGSLVLGASDPGGNDRGEGYRGALSGEIIGVLADQADTTRRGAAVVGCRRIIRTQVLSFAALRRLRFDAGPAGDAACRALLAAYALAGLARANAELTFRAGCDLVEAAPASVKLDARNGDFVALEPASVEAADQVLERALAEARREADIDWRGQIFEVTGDPAVTDGPEPRRFRLPHLGGKQPAPTSG